MPRRDACLPGTADHRDEKSSNVMPSFVTRNISGLQTAMDHAGTVRRIECVEDLDGAFPCRLRRQGTLQYVTVDVLHHPISRAYIVKRPPHALPGPSVPRTFRRKSSPPRCGQAAYREPYRLRPFHRCRWERGSHTAIRGQRHMDCILPYRTEKIPASGMAISGAVSEPSSETSCRGRFGLNSQAT